MDAIKTAACTKDALTWWCTNPGRRRSPGGLRNLRAEGRGGDPLRIIMGLADRNSVAFSMLGHQDFALFVLELRRAR